jgi:hypothetical protein
MYGLGGENIGNKTSGVTKNDDAFTKADIYGTKWHQQIEKF